MKSITIHPQSTEQLETIKAFLNALNVPFEPLPIDLPRHVSDSVEKGLSQIEAGNTISLDDFKARHFRKK